MFETFKKMFGPKSHQIHETQWTTTTIYSSNEGSELEASVVQEREVKSFSGIQNNLPGTVEIVVDPSLEVDHRVTVEAPEQLQNRFVVKSDGSLLVLGMTSGNFATTAKICVRVYARSLQSLNTQGQGAVSIQGVRGKLFTLTNNGQGRLTFSAGGFLKTLSCDLKGQGTVSLENLDCSQLILDSGGMGSLKAFGKVTDAFYNLSGQGSVDLSALRATNVRLSSSGMGSLKLWCSGECSGTSSGMGSVQITGSPTRFQVRHMGLGSCRVV